MRKRIVVALLMTAAAIPVAEGGERVPPVTDPVVKKECGSCHMVFPPQFLPRRSWQKLADTLADHFGENAGLGDAQRAGECVDEPVELDRAIESEQHGRHERRQRLRGVDARLMQPARRIFEKRHGRSGGRRQVPWCPCLARSAAESASLPDAAPT